jgi:hypothetical protein
MPLIHGTLLSGIAMTANDLTIDSLVLRHETGHLTGLAHTSEQDVGIGDRLSDTPLCNDVLTQGLGCPDVDHLMFPFAIPNSPNILSPKQSTVIQASPLYRGAVEENGGFAEPLARTSARAAPAPVDRAARLPEPAGDWSARHGADLVRLASAHWCQRHAPGSAPPDGSALLQLHAGEGDLWRLAADRGAPGYVRARALTAAAAAPLDAAELAALAAFGQDQSEPRTLRAAALERLSLAGRALPAIADPILKRLLAHRQR